MRKSQEKLLKILESDEYSTNQEIIEKFCVDWRGEFKGKSNLIIFPKSIKKISKVLEYCQKEKLSIVPQGGNTSLVGGAVPRSNKNDIIINLSKLCKIRNIDLVGNSITIESGCILDDIKKELRKHSLVFPLSMGSRGSCQIGGNIATNAGGVNVIKYGTIRHNILGLEAVLPDGTIYSSLKNVKKNNTGLDLKHLLIGSEGILGIITAATIKIYPSPKEQVVIWASFENFTKVLNYYVYIVKQFSELITSFEFMNRESIEILEKHELKVEKLKKNKCYCLLELSNFHDIENFTDFISSKINFDMLSTDDCIISKSEAENKRLWSYRESIPLAEKKENFIIPHDVSIPLNNIEKFVNETSKKITKIFNKSKIINFGHLGDNNLHYNILIKNNYAEDKVKIINSVNKIVFQSVNKFGGAISAEHGIGQLRKKELTHHKDIDELNKMKGIKKLFDPNNILNPGKVI